MKVLVMIISLIAAAVLQAILPGWTLLGQVKPPFLLGLVIYYALVHERRTMLQAAVFGGLLQDGLSMTPLGYSSFGFCILGLIARKFRDSVFIHETVTHMIFGAVAYVGMTLTLMALLSNGGLVVVDPAWASFKVVGSCLLGALVVPITFFVAETLDKTLGNIGERSA